MNSIYIVKLTKDEDETETYFTLSFTYFFEYEKDKVFFVFSFPYLYSDVTKFVSKVQVNENKNLYFSKLEFLPEML